MNAWLEARAVDQRYRIGDREIPVLRDVSLSVERGEAVAIVGASGAGKSTLLNILGGLDRPTGGSVHFDGQDIYRLTPARRSRLRAHRIGFIFQAFHLLPELDVLENVLLPALARPRAGRRSTNLRARARDLLDQVELGPRADHRPDELSGGEQQRVALARALMNEPDVVLADEPTGNLDSVTGEHVLNCLFDLVRDQQRTLLLVTHNEVLADRCARTLVLRDGGLT